MKPFGPLSGFNDWRGFGGAPPQFNPLTLPNLALLLDPANTYEDGAAVFNGANYLSCVSNPSLQATGIRVFTGWFKLNRTDIFQRTFGKFNSGDEEYVLEFVNDGYAKFYIKTDYTNYLYVSVPTPCATGVWYFYVCAIDTVAKSYSIQLNAGTVVSASYTGTIQVGSADLGLGSGGDNSVLLNGSIDSFGIYDRSLTSTEITALYNAGAGHTWDTLPASLQDAVVWLDCDEDGSATYVNKGTLGSAGNFTNNGGVALGPGIAVGKALLDDPITLLIEPIQGLNLTQPVLASRPKLEYADALGRDVIRFNGSNVLSRANVLGSDLFSADECYIAAVLSQPLAGTCCLFSFSASFPVRIYASFTGIIYFDFAYIGGAGRVSVVQPAGWNTGFHLLECWRQGDGTQVIVVDGVTLINDTQSGTLDITTPGQLELGAVISSYYFSGDIAYFDILKRVPSAAVRSNFKKWVNSYFGLAVAL